LRTKFVAIHAQAVEILVVKGQFESDEALVITEAIDVSMKLEQFVTVPILDARLADLKAELRGDMASLRAEVKETKAELVRWVFLTMLGNVALTLAASAVWKALSGLL
jgi:hypothetical protein